MDVSLRLRPIRYVAVALVCASLSLVCGAQQGAGAEAQRPAPLRLDAAKTVISSFTSDERLKFQNGVFYVHKGILLNLWTREGRPISELKLQPPAQPGARVWSQGVSDVAIEADGSIVAQYFWAEGRDGVTKAFSALIHYSQQGTILETLDIGHADAKRLCLTDDKNVWTISFTPGEAEGGVLRHYRFGSGLVETLNPQVPSDPGAQHFRRLDKIARRSAIDCSGGQVYALLPEDEGPGSVWVQAGGGDPSTPLKVRDMDVHADGSNLFVKSLGVIDGKIVFLVFQPDFESSRYIPAEMLLGGDGASVEYRSLDILADAPVAAGGDGSAAQAKAPVAVTSLLGIDRVDKKTYLVYKLPGGSGIAWSEMER